jgi:hypothetical protein
VLWHLLPRAIPTDASTIDELRPKQLLCGSVGDAPGTNLLIKLALGIHRTGVDVPARLIAGDTGSVGDLD